MSVDVAYVRHVKGLLPLARRYGFDVLIVLLAVEAMFEVAFRRGVPDAPRTTLWFTVPAIAVLVLPLFARRRFPFAAPAVFWLLAVGISFVDGRLVTFMTSVYVLGMAASFLLGNQRGAVAAQLGLAIAVGGTAVVVYNKPAHSVSELVFIPLVFGVCWLAGFVVRERAEQAQTAELRAAQAERERDAAARIAVAEERARIARELHDIVAHAVSVMVLQVGAVRHKLPDALAEDRDALSTVEQAGRTALAEMRRLLPPCAATRTTSTWCPSPASTPSAPWSTRSAGPACPSGCTSTASRSRSRRRSTFRPTGSFRRA